MAQDISEENSKEMGPTLKVGMKNIDTSLRSVDFAWNKFYMVVGQATNNVIATLYLSVIHIDTSNYLPSRRVLRPPEADRSNNVSNLQRHTKPRQRRGGIVIKKPEFELSTLALTLLRL
jgi:hypothetical protein